MTVNQFPTLPHQAFEECYQSDVTTQKLKHLRSLIKRFTGFLCLEERRGRFGGDSGNACGGDGDPCGCCWFWALEGIEVGIRWRKKRRFLTKTRPLCVLT